MTDIQTSDIIWTSIHTTSDDDFLHFLSTSSSGSFSIKIFIFILF